MVDDEPTEEIPVVVAPPVIPTHAAPPRRRRWPWVVLTAVLVGMLVLAGGGLWYVSGLIGDGARVPQPDAGFPVTVTSVDGTTIRYDGVVDEASDQGLQGIATADGGYVQTVPGATPGERTVTGEVLRPPLAVGQAAVLDGGYFPRDPQVGLGLAFQEVGIQTPLGPAPAWYLPGSSDTWVIHVHGRGATPAEGMRIAEIAAGRGYPVLLIRYRNDARAPAGTGYAQFGAQEWPDLEAAVQFALDNGARRVVLAGTSMGASISLAFLENSALADRVAGAFLDAPLADFGQVVDLGAADLGLPGWVAAAARQVAGWRYGFDWEATDYTARAGQLAVRMLIVHGTADATVPVQVGRDLAAAANPALVTMEEFDGAGHLLSWNVDRDRYTRLLGGFLDEVAAAPSPS